MSLRPTEKNLRHTELSLTVRHTVQEPLPYSARASAIQNKFFKTLVYVFKKRLLEFFQRSGKIVLLKILII